ncbi:BamA/TamA family outer membrane protein [Carboxylicivirga sp. A043]|uniref:outer membrane protein assembly factor n=1 Tax=Carboxylicivirga litoralis TaxID=2816963 RepID=UPI0021CB7A6A|nr:outer membrane protein assembly factor [Carboxylicivirga sp. A043]MCU4154651.1 BamA/TamA family outer membrane protein [Carboxylicivirga sp. A043]
MRKLLFCLALTAVCLLSSYAQVDSLSNKILNNLDSLRFAEYEGNSFKIMPYVAPSYTPETEWLLSGGGLITFKTYKDKLLNLSSIPFSVGYSTNGSFAVKAINVIYWKNDNIRSIGEFQLRDMPDNYWGIGFQNGDTIPQGENTTAYKRNYWRFYQRLMFRTRKDIFVGLVVDINRTRAEDMNPLMQNDIHVKEGGTDIFNTGIGIEIDYDSRDFVQNAYDGFFISGIFTAYDNFFGGETDYNILELDYRHYKTIRRERRTLAWQFKSRFTFSGSTPWTDKSMLGGLENMRGYTMGRFRDDNMMFTTVEYRHMFKRKTLNKKNNYNSRFGYVVWLGTGSVASTIETFTHWLPNGGVGLRAELQPRMNIRVDYGIAKGENGVYITFAEVF